MLDGFFVIDSWRTDSEIFSVRLVPDHFEEGLADPVMTICVTGLQGSMECEAALQLRKDELIVDLEVSDTGAAIYAEQDNEPVWLRGSHVSATRGPYMIDDLHRILRQKEEEIRLYHEQLHDYRARVERAESFMSELIRRAEIKRDMTSRDSAWLDREVDVLQRVLQRIRER
jgi:hypothetical protein